MAEAAPVQDVIEDRAAPRFPVSFRSVVLECDMFGEQVDVVNIARLGFLARTRLIRSSGESLRLHLPDLGMLQAEVVWCSNGLLGARFHDPIDERSFADFLEGLG
jgi:hypothetical protein